MDFNFNSQYSRTKRRYKVAWTSKPSCLFLHSSQTQVFDGPVGSKSSYRNLYKFGVVRFPESFDITDIATCIICRTPGLGYKTFSDSTQLSMIFIIFRNQLGIIFAHTDTLFLRFLMFFFVFFFSIMLAESC